MAIHDGVYKLTNLLQEMGLHPGDVLVELRQVTLAAGTAECPTIFANGQILTCLCTQVNNAVVNSSVAISTDKVVSTGAITIVGPTGSVAVVDVLLIGRVGVV